MLEAAERSNDEVVWELLEGDADADAVAVSRGRVCSGAGLAFVTPVP